MDSSSTDKLENINREFIGYIEGLSQEDISDMLSLRVIPSFLSSIRSHGYAAFSEGALKDWIVDMLLCELKGSTVKRYAGALHTIYKKWEKINGIEDQGVKFSIPTDIYRIEYSKMLSDIGHNLEATDRLTKISIKHDSPSYVVNKVFQYLLFNPLASLKDAVILKYSDPMPDIEHIDDIVTSMRNAPQAKYVFPLLQGKKREGAIIRDLLSDLHSTAKRAGFKFGDSFSRDSITSIWIAAALKSEIAVSEIRAIVINLPISYSFLSLIPASEISEHRKIEILNTVAYSLTNKTPGWFVLRLRSGVTPEKIKERLKEKESPLQNQIQYYYPLRAVKKIEKKKVVSVEEPVIPGLLFIRLPYDRVTTLVSIIGDLAWCYRSTANPKSPYSVIPQKEMRIFQKCVGAFTSDVELDIISELPPLNVGDEVVIENGTHLDGQIATIRAVRSVDGMLTYTLRLSETEYIKWNDVNLPASHISKVDK
ncbi:MAG: hypothetical protein K2G85_07050 [Muribaculaceae bacterium]|nr:hypothetical protein [Muribaculaceae bacterium]